MASQKVSVIVQYVVDLDFSVLITFPSLCSSDVLNSILRYRIGPKTEMKTFDVTHV